MSSGDWRFTTRSSNLDEKSELGCQPQEMLQGTQWWQALNRGLICGYSSLPSPALSLFQLRRAVIVPFLFLLLFLLDPGLAQPWSTAVLCSPEST